MTTVPDSPPSPEAPVAPHDYAGRERLAVLALAALGVVYGDIGTSPLYALKECFAPEYGVVPTSANVLGVLSLIFWSLNFVVSFKYLAFIMRADNRGEGGIMALLALLHPRRQRMGARRLLVGFGLFGAALLYGDGVITPAISVLGAVEGISVAAPQLPDWVVPDPVEPHPGRAVHVPAARHGPSGRRLRARSWWCGSPPSPCSASAASSGTPRSSPRSTPGTRSPSSAATECTVSSSSAPSSSW